MGQPLKASFQNELAKVSGREMADCYIKTKNNPILFSHILGCELYLRLSIDIPKMFRAPLRGHRPE
jgi:hypothetical protein